MDSLKGKITCFCKFQNDGRLTQSHGVNMSPTRLLVLLCTTAGLATSAQDRLLCILLKRAFEELIISCGKQLSLSHCP